MSSTEVGISINKYTVNFFPDVQSVDCGRCELCGAKYLCGKCGGVAPVLMNYLRALMDASDEDVLYGPLHKLGKLRNIDEGIARMAK